MNRLYDQIQADQLKYRKQGNRLDSNALTYLLGEIGRQKTQDLSDKAVLAVVKSTVKRLSAAQDIARSEAGLRELQLLQGYLPKEMQGVELEALINDMSFSTMPEAMRQIKALNAPINMQQAAALVKAALA